MCRSVLLAALLAPGGLLALGDPPYITYSPAPAAFPIAHNHACAPIYVSNSDWPGVIRAASDLQADIARVTGCTPFITHDANAHNPILIGSVEKNPFIAKLATAPIAGKWECFQIKTLPSHSLLIAGSDKRGTIYGIYDLSQQIGVSPWYWWADVPVVHKEALYVRPGSYVQGEPAVKYRGIFLNDEAPSLSGWTYEKNGGFNRKLYTKVFELILRLKSNYLWPAMWGSAFNEDDPADPKLADEYGIVMGTSHHEPMLRAQQEWKRHGRGYWNYATNADVLRAFWDEGIQRNKNYESIVTLGMRGDGDMPMAANGGMRANIELLEKIVADQRAILARRMHPDVTKIPQDWALYKEVQAYYEAGMRVPDDVTLLWCDDNWGNIRRLPTPAERKRSGGAGIYYHFDYVGDPRNYKWLNTIPITKVWEQMNLAYQYGARRIWIVNVGDLKPMEFPIEFFLDYAWNPARWPHNKLTEFGRLWATREFGPEHATEIADLVAKYTKYNGRRKPELLEPGTFSLDHYDEADRVLAEWKAIETEAEDLYRRLPDEQKDAFFELVLYPVKACAQVNELYIAVEKNRAYAAEGRARANDYASQVVQLFQADADLSATYNHILADGKWDHMMDQTHIGYTGWQQPPTNIMPRITRIDIPETGTLGVEPLALQFDAFNQSRRHIDIFNRGRAPRSFAAKATEPWIHLSATTGTVQKDERLWVTIDWSKAPTGTAVGTIDIAGNQIKLTEFSPREITRDSLRGFVEADGFVSIEAAHYTRRTATAAAHWDEIADYGRTLSSMTIFPCTAPSVTLPHDSPSLEYRMYLFDPHQVTVHAIIAPTLNFVPGRGLRFAISFDNQPPKIIDALTHNTQHDWEESVKDSVRDIQSTDSLSGTGYHTLKFWMVDPAVVLQKLIVDLGGLQPSYLGPPESYFR